MNILLSSLAAGILASAAFSVAAETRSSANQASVFGYDDGILVLAQQEAANDYQKYLDRMMDESTGAMLDMNGDGVITRAEFIEFHGNVYDMMDENHDNKVMGDEMPKTLRSDG